MCMLKMYSYKGCDACRKAVKHLDSLGVAFENLPIRETPPRKDELRKMLDYYEGNLRRLFNVSGVDYRQLGLKDSLPNMSVDEAIELLASNGNLVKRPFVLGTASGVVGFKPEEWTERLAL